ncbi:hypothetical protein IC006_0398 [Sulfuracidifex tepidarius]|uniref:Uncharacterized protein n=1 Tax=Sulfuracidifex tepidarius TaxID=1294262 RepID=A0A510DSI1_9CREN|nr:hypothetical protein [Sulfuracidifex tepidarius]BBG23114.1 hypothetical protein IC006_0398 [Sulfuracidifex tepidarius]
MEMVRKADLLLSKVTYFYLGKSLFSLNYKVLSHMPDMVKDKLIVWLTSSLYDDSKSMKVEHHLMEGKGLTHINDTNLKSDAGIFTGESVVIRRGIPLESMGINTDTVGSMEVGFHDWFKRGGISLMEGIEDGENVTELASKLRTDVKGDAVRTLTHEHLHWRTLKGTSAGSIIDAVSWRVELDQAVFSEMVHELTGVPREVNQNTLELIKKNSDEIVGAMMREDAVSLFEDLVKHSYFLSFYYPSMISVLLEPVAWALVEEDFVKKKEEYLDYYFSSLSDRSREIAGTVLDASVERVRRGERKSLINACRDALDFPMSEASSMKVVGEADPYSLTQQLTRSHEYLFDRFMKSLQGEEITRENKAERSFRRVLVYGGKKATNEFGVNILRKNLNPSIYGLSLMMSRYTKLALDKPSFIVYSHSKGNEPVILVYDVTAPSLRSMGKSIESVNVSPLTGRVVYRPMDMVGELGYSIVPSLLIMYYSSFLGEVDEEELLRQLVQIGFTIKFMSGNYKEYLKFVKSIFNGDVKGSYPRVLSGGSEGMEEFLRFWLNLVTRLGESCRFLSAEQGMQC